MYITMCTYLAATILEMDLKEILWRNEKKIQFSNSIVKKKTNKCYELLWKEYRTKEEPYPAINP